MKPNRVDGSGHVLKADNSTMRRLTRFTRDSSISNEKLLELGNSGVAEIVNDVEGVSCSVEAHDFGSTDNFRKSINFFTAGSDNESGEITHTSFDNACVDFTLVVSSGTNQDAIAHTEWCGGQWLTSISSSFSVDGTATETFGFEGEHQRYLLNAYRDSRVASGARLNSSTALVNGFNLQTGYTPIIVTVDTEIVADTKDGDTITLSDSGSDTNVTASPALNLTDGQRIRLVYAKDVPDSFPELGSTPDGLAGLRKGMIDIYLQANYSSERERVLRCRSCSIDVSLDRTTKNQLGSDTAYFRSLNKPIDVSMSLELDASDLEELAKFADQETAFDDMSLNQLDAGDFVNNATLIVEMYKSEKTHTLVNFLKKIVISGVSITSDSGEATAGADGTKTIGLTSDNYKIVTSGTSCFL